MVSIKNTLSALAISLGLVAAPSIAQNVPKMMDGSNPLTLHQLSYSRFIPGVNKEGKVDVVWKNGDNRVPILQASTVNDMKSDVFKGYRMADKKNYLSAEYKHFLYFFYLDSPAEFKQFLHDEVLRNDNLDLDTAKMAIRLDRGVIKDITYSGSADRNGRSLDGIVQPNNSSVTLPGHILWAEKDTLFVPLSVYYKALDRADGAGLQDEIRRMKLFFTSEFESIYADYNNLKNITKNIRDAADSLQRENMKLLPYLLSRFEPVIGWTVPSSKKLSEGRMIIGLGMKVPYTPLELIGTYASRDINTTYAPVTVRETEDVLGPFNMTAVSEGTSHKIMKRGPAADFNLGIAITDDVSMLFGIGEEKRTTISSGMYSTYFVPKGTNERINASDTPFQTVEDGSWFKRYSAGLKVNALNPISISYVLTKIEHDDALEHSLRIGLNLKDIFAP